MNDETGQIPERTEHSGILGFLSLTNPDGIAECNVLYVHSKPGIAMCLQRRPSPRESVNRSWSFRFGVLHAHRVEWSLRN
jgi:hypothetical protein